MANSLGAKVKYEDIYLPEHGREKTTDEITATLDEWDRFSKRAKPPVIFGERI